MKNKVMFLKINEKVADAFNHKCRELGLGIDETRRAVMEQAMQDFIKNAKFSVKSVVSEALKGGK